MMDRRTFLKGVALVGGGLLIPRTVFPVEPGAIEPTPDRPLDSLGYLVIHFWYQPDVRFEIDETWLMLTKTESGFRVSIRSVEFVAGQECTVTGASLLTVRGESIRECRLSQERHLAPGDILMLSYDLLARFE